MSSAPVMLERRRSTLKTADERKQVFLWTAYKTKLFPILENGPNTKLRAQLLWIRVDGYRTVRAIEINPVTEIRFECLFHCEMTAIPRPYVGQNVNAGKD